MAKTQEELKELKNEYESLNKKLKELSDEELEEVVGGDWLDVLHKIGEGMRSVVQPVLGASPEEQLGGKIYVVPDNSENK